MPLSDIYSVLEISSLPMYLWINTHKRIETEKNSTNSKSQREEQGRRERNRKIQNKNKRPSFLLSLSLSSLSRLSNSLVPGMLTRRVRTLFYFIFYFFVRHEKSSTAVPRTGECLRPKMVTRPAGHLHITLLDRPVIYR